MKFTKHPPITSGRYWYIDISYPVPRICWFEPPNTMWVLHGGETVLQATHYEHYRWGSKVEGPDLADCEVEY